MASRNGSCPFRPGIIMSTEDFICYNDIADVPAVCHDSLETVCRNIREKLIRGVEKRLDADAPLGFLLSGGLDSSLVCSIAAKILQKPIRTFAIGMSEDAIDLKYAKEVGRLYRQRPYRGHNYIKIEVLESLEEVDSAFLVHTILQQSAPASGCILFARPFMRTTDIRVLLTGEISDELFGYKYTDFAPSPEAFQEEAVKRIREIHMYDVLRADRCISVNSMEARVPFGDIDFVRYVMAVDPALKVNTLREGKISVCVTRSKTLRRASICPDPILLREKAAFSATPSAIPW